MTADICGRLDQLERLGLGHLSLGRRTTMLSSGELQRIRLATQLISRLFGVIYVLDEPAAGLHPEDVRALLQSLRLLLEAGNSLVIVEHNLDVIAEADWLTEVGPGPGRWVVRSFITAHPPGWHEFPAHLPQATSSTNTVRACVGVDFPSAGSSLRKSPAITFTGWMSASLLNV